MDATTFDVFDHSWVDRNTTKIIDGISADPSFVVLNEERNGDGKVIRITGEYRKPVL